MLEIFTFGSKKGKLTSCGLAHINVHLNDGSVYLMDTYIVKSDRPVRSFAQCSIYQAKEQKFGLRFELKI